MGKIKGLAEWDGFNHSHYYVVVTVKPLELGEVLSGSYFWRDRRATTYSYVRKPREKPININAMLEGKQAKKDKVARQVAGLKGLNVELISYLRLPMLCIQVRLMHKCPQMTLSKNQSRCCLLYRRWSQWASNGSSNIITTRNLKSSALTGVTVQPLSYHTSTRSNVPKDLKIRESIWVIQNYIIDYSTLFLIINKFYTNFESWTYDLRFIIVSHESGHNDCKIIKCQCYWISEQVN